MSTECDDFGCCGGNDETPKIHTQDCSKYPPLCVFCGERQSTRTIAYGDAYARSCDVCQPNRKSVE